MSTATPDTQLEYELQDLYISSRHWLSDVSFVGDEIRFFKDVVQKYLALNNDTERSGRVHHCKMMLFKQHTETISLEIKVTAYLNFLASYVNDQGKPIGINLIEKHTLLANEMAALFESFRLLKMELFPLTEAASNHSI